jgi:hypothetical protein
MPPVDRTRMVRRMLTLMLVLIRPAGLGFELGAHLLEELSQTIARRCLPGRAHATMRVVHDCFVAGLVDLAQWLAGCCNDCVLDVSSASGLRSRWRCAFSLVPCREAPEG